MAEQTEFSGAGSASGLQLAASEEDAGRLDGSSRWRLAAVIVALVLFAEAITFQQSMISNIVPKLAASFPQAGANVTWSITILGVAGGATMALIGKLGDLIGKRWVMLICGVLFAAGCLVCAVTTTWALFMVGRALCGISLGLSAADYGIVRDLMPRRWIPVTVGVIGTGLGFSAILGPIIAGWLTDAFSWRSCSGSCSSSSSPSSRSSCWLCRRRRCAPGSAWTCSAPRCSGPGSARRWSTSARDRRGDGGTSAAWPT